MEKTATPINASVELLPPVQADGDKASDEAVSELDFFEALIGKVVEISPLSVFP